jgi:release factor glutamine methyltransferase
VNIKEALTIASNELADIPSRHLDARVLLSHTLKKPVEYIILNYDTELIDAIKELYFSLVTRRKKLEPIAYIISGKEFYGRIFYVNKNVLIPRNDTEILIDLVINQYKEIYNTDIKILDLGTGSGIIALTLALEIKQAQITAIDNSASALFVAKYNAQSYDLLDRVKIVQSNWYESLNNEKFDFIVSNPPYIDLSEQSIMAKETIIYEPKNALYSSNNGLADYELIIKEAKQYLNPNGLLFLEIGFTQAKLVTELLSTYGFQVLSTQKDLQGHERAICAKMH